MGERIKITDRYLNMAYAVNQRIKNKTDQLEILNSMVYAITPTINGLPKSTLDDNSHHIDKLIDLQNEINNEIDKLIDCKNYVAEIINAVDEGVYRDLLEKRYLCFKPWKQIADEINYCPRHIYRLRRLALISAYNVICNKLNNNMSVNVTTQHTLDDGIIKL